MCIFVKKKKIKKILCFLPPGQFLLEQSRLGEAAEMAERAAALDSFEFDVVFSAAHMLRLAELKEHDSRNAEGIFLNFFFSFFLNK